MSAQPRLLIAAHPTRGVDVGAQAAIWELLKDARAEGLGILLISADLDELIGLSDTLHVMLRGAARGHARPAPGDARAARRLHDRRAHRGGCGVNVVRRIGLRCSPPSWRSSSRWSSPPLVMAAAGGQTRCRVFKVMVDFGDTPSSRSPRSSSILNRAIPLFLAGLAVAIAFRMGLFNIGVEGQYRMATIVAAAVGAAVALPGPLHVALIIVVAMAWARSGPASSPSSRSPAASAR